MRRAPSLHMAAEVTRHTHADYTPAAQVGAAQFALVTCMLLHPAHPQGPRALCMRQALSLSLGSQRRSIGRIFTSATATAHIATAVVGGGIYSFLGSSFLGSSFLGGGMTGGSPSLNLISGLLTSPPGPAQYGPPGAGQASDFSLYFAYVFS